MAGGWVGRRAGQLNGPADSSGLVVVLVIDEQVLHPLDGADSVEPGIDTGKVRTGGDPLPHLIGDGDATPLQDTQNTFRLALGPSFDLALGPSFDFALGLALQVRLLEEGSRPGKYVATIFSSSLHVSRAGVFSRPTSSNSHQYMAVALSSDRIPWAIKFSMAGLFLLSLCTIAANVAIAGCRATIDSSVISGTFSGPSTKGRVTCVSHAPTRHSKGPAAQLAVDRSRQTATSSTGKSNFARR
ncbi:hypothetical protein WKI71_26800 [Streptomyces sp. MS1.AVA.1]|uniref:Uncharacterized protein n=1 Tax=Streptomyces machairae TaxID=3134109 RepID=A0ABU8UP71_9ACTN